MDFNVNDIAKLLIPKYVRSYFLHSQFDVRVLQKLVGVGDVEQVDSEEDFVRGVNPPFVRWKTSHHLESLGICDRNRSH